MKTDASRLCSTCIPALNSTASPAIADGALIAILRMDTPPGSAREKSSAARAAFWKGGSAKRLMQGGLFALLWKDGSGVRMHLGLIASSCEDLAESAKRERSTLELKAQFFDPGVNFTFLEAGTRQYWSGNDPC